MSFKTMLKHRCKVLFLAEGELNGYPTHVWSPVQRPTGVPGETEDLVIPCFLDLNFIRKGKDPVWTPEAGRATDRSGVLFALGTAPITASSRLLMTKGPQGTFSVEMAVDEAWRPDSMHHIEVGVTEVAKQIAGVQP